MFSPPLTSSPMRSSVMYRREVVSYSLRLVYFLMSRGGGSGLAAGLGLRPPAVRALGRTLAGLSWSLEPGG
jgi:hypothetical protein